MKTYITRVVRFEVDADTVAALLETYVREHAGTISVPSGPPTISILHQESPKGRPYAYPSDCVKLLPTASEDPPDDWAYRSYHAIVKWREEI